MKNKVFTSINIMGLAIGFTCCMLIAQGTPMLFSPYSLGPLPLANRIVMPPMTRSRAANGVADVLTSMATLVASQLAAFAGRVVQPQQKG